MKRIGDLVPPFTPCVNCASSSGWIISPDGSTYVRCPCWTQHQRRVVDAIRAASVTRKTADR